MPVQAQNIARGVMLRDHERVARKRLIRLAQIADRDGLSEAHRALMLCLTSLDDAVLAFEAKL